MTDLRQREELQKTIWDMAENLRGAVNGWDFKQYVLGALFYRFASENITAYMESDDSVDYASISDEAITPNVKDATIRTKGYFIYPSQLFNNVLSKYEESKRQAENNSNTEGQPFSLCEELPKIFQAIENSATGYPSESRIKGLLSDFDTTSELLGDTVKEKNERLASVLTGIKELNFGKFEDSKIDLFGDAYEFLISNYAANAGKSGGESFTPQTISSLIAQLAMHGMDSVNRIYDPTCGSGSLLLQAKRQCDDHIIEQGLYGQEINHATYNLARMNMLLHNINYDKFDIVRGDTLLNPIHHNNGLGKEAFDAIVSNLPYSLSWVGKQDSTLINDERYAPAGVLAPSSKADFAFVMHALHHLSPRGRAAIVCFPGIFYRSGAEKKIRQYLVDNNFVETIISLPGNMFYGTSIAVNILVLSKHKSDTKTQFIDAAEAELFTKSGKYNVLTDEHIARLVNLFATKEEVAHVATSVDLDTIAANDYTLSVSTYVEPKDPRLAIDMEQLEEQIENCVARVTELRNKIKSFNQATKQ